MATIRERLACVLTTGRVVTARASPLSRGIRYGVPAALALLAAPGCRANEVGGPKDTGQARGQKGIVIVLEEPKRPFLIGAPTILRGRIRSTSNQLVHLPLLCPERGRWEAEGVAPVGTAQYVDGKLVGRKETLLFLYESFTWVEVARVAGKARESADGPVEVPLSQMEEIAFDLAPGQERSFEFDLLKTDMGQQVIDAPGRFVVSLTYSYRISARPSSKAVGKPWERRGSAGSNRITITVLGEKRE